VGAAAYIQAQMRREHIHRAYADLFTRTGAAVLLTPTLGCEAFPVDRSFPETIGGVAIDPPRQDWGGFLFDANLAGLPAVALPMGLGDERLPISLQASGAPRARRRAARRRGADRVGARVPGTSAGAARGAYVSLQAGPGEDRPTLRTAAVDITFHAVAEPHPGEAWRARFEAFWPAYRDWFLRDGDAARPSYPIASRMLREHMPELTPAWERMVELAGGGDLVARMLALYDPPPLVAGCSQAAVGGRWPLLVRNYDFNPRKLEAVVLSTALTGRGVIGMSDCVWGLLDGVNDAGLAVSLAFGGRRELGGGFGISIVIRYLLETCTTARAQKTLTRLPIQAAYNLTLVDAGGDAVTVFVGPDRAPRAERPAVATNHQEAADWPEHERATRSVERRARLDELVAEPDGGSPRGRVPAAAAVLDAVRARLRHALHRRLPPGGRRRRVPLARRALAPVVRRLLRGLAHGHARRLPSVAAGELSARERDIGDRRPHVLWRRAGLELEGRSQRIEREHVPVRLVVLGRARSPVAAVAERVLTLERTRRDLALLQAARARLDREERPMHERSVGRVGVVEQQCQRASLGRHAGPFQRR
jgi:predicted choloylglycine hydrolase